MNEEKETNVKSSSIVSFRNVTKIFNQGTRNECVALENVSFEVEDLSEVGEFISIVGPSGSGKSTLLNLIAGFPSVGGPTQGEVLVREKPVTSPVKGIGMIFQNNTFFEHLTALENVKFALDINKKELGLDDKQVMEAARDMISKVRMSDYENSYAWQLSAEQQQRINIARALVYKPRIILMDEPFSLMEDSSRYAMQSLILGLWRDIQATVFIVTRSLNEAVYLGDRIFMLKSAPGRLAVQKAILSNELDKDPDKTPREIQESKEFRDYIKDIASEYRKIGETE